MPRCPLVSSVFRMTRSSELDTTQRERRPSTRPVILPPRQLDSSRLLSGQSGGGYDSVRQVK